MIDNPREIATDAPLLPRSLAERLGGRTWWRDMIGEAGCAVYRIAAGSAPDLYLKHGTGDFARDVVDEMVRLDWLSAHLPVPAVRQFAAEDDQAWLVTTALPGRRHGR